MSADPVDAAGTVEAARAGSDDASTGSGLTPRGERTAARLRAAARKAFAELGWQATRVQDIVERAGVSHGTFYTYFENKAAVLEALVRDSQDDFEDLARRSWEAEGPDGERDEVRAALRKVIGGFLDLYQRDADLMRTWLHAAREEDQFGALYLELRGRFIDRITEQVGSVIAVSGREDAPPARTVASALAAMVEHFAYCWAVLGEQHDRSSAVDALVLLWASAINGLAGFRVVRV